MKTVLAVVLSLATGLIADAAFASNRAPYGSLAYSLEPIETQLGFVRESLKGERILPGRLMTSRLAEDLESLLAKLADVVGRTDLPIRREKMVLLDQIIQLRGVLGLATPYTWIEDLTVRRSG